MPSDGLILTKHLNFEYVILPPLNNDLPMKYYVLVTGASTGIGRHACRLFASRGYGILAGIRSEADAGGLREELGADVHPLVLDVTEDAAVQTAAEIASGMLSGERRLVAIVNNAGVAVHGPVLYVPPAEWSRQLDINVVGAVRVTQAFFPLLLRPANDPDDRHPRRIINVSSISGRFAAPFVGPYAASKYALEALSDSLRRELFMHDVQVVLIQPGKIRTPIWQKAGGGPDYAGTEYEALFKEKDRILARNHEQGLPVEALTPAFLKALQGPRPARRYLVVKAAFRQRLLTSLPAGILDRMIAKALRKRTGFRPV